MLEVEQALNKFAKDVVKTSKSNLIRSGRTSTRGLYHSLDSVLNVSPNSFSLEFDMNDYGEFIDKGVSGKEVKHDTPYSFKNKMPPRKDILKWVNRKRLRLRDDKGKFKRGGQESLAFLIQRSVFKKGIKPSLFFTKAFEQHFKELPKELETAFALDVEGFMEFTKKK